MLLHLRQSYPSTISNPNSCWSRFHLIHIFLIHSSISCLPGSSISVPAKNKGHPPQHEFGCSKLITRVCRHSLLLPVVPPQMDPIQKAVMTHTFGPPMVKTKRPIISCNVCQIRFNSEVRKPTAAVGSNPCSEGQTRRYFLESLFLFFFLSTVGYLDTWTWRFSYVVQCCFIF